MTALGWALFVGLGTMYVVAAIAIIGSNSRPDDWVQEMHRNQRRERRKEMIKRILG